MGWRDELLEASLGKVTFKVAATEVSAGRLHAVHKFAGSTERPWVEDLGVAGEEFSVDAYVLGADYLEQRRKLLEVATRPNQALRLQLPTWSPRIVFCTSVRIRESSTEGGFARFELGFRVVDDRVTIAKAVKPASDASSKANTVQDQAGASLEESLDTSGPAYVLEGAADALREAGRAIQGLDLTAGLSAAVGDLTLAANRLVDDALELVTAPADLVSQAIAAVVGIETALASAPQAALEAYRVLFELEIPSLGLSSVLGQRRDRNAAAVTSLVRQLAIAAYARTAVVASWETRTDAELARQRVLDAIELEAESAEDKAYNALVALRASIVNALPPADQDLPDLVRISAPGDTTTIALAYKLYDDASRDDEIRERNRLRNPAFVPPGLELEVLSV